jgi:hypothetical protein
VAARTDAARAEVVAARDGFAAEFDRLGPATRTAIDVPAKIRKAPVQSAALAGGAAFLLLGGPKRALGRLNRLVRGEPEPLPKSMLPDEVERAVRALGPDGNQVRGALERSFAEYLDHQGSFTQRTVRSASGDAIGTIIRYVGRGVGISLLRRILAGPGPLPAPGGIIAGEKARFAAAVDKAHQRVAEETEPGGEGAGPKT